MSYKSEEIYGFEIDEEFFRENKKVLQHVANGFARVLILWIIQHEKKIHGYGILKELNGFFEVQIENNIIKEFPSSKVYPMLKSFEKAEVIEGEWIEEKTKKVKYYSITKKGEAFLKFISEQQNSMKDDPKWELFLSDFYGLD